MYISICALYLCRYTAVLTCTMFLCRCVFSYILFPSHTFCVFMWNSNAFVALLYYLIFDVLLSSAEQLSWQMFPQGINSSSLNLNDLDLFSYPPSPPQFPGERVLPPGAAVSLPGRQPCGPAHRHQLRRHGSGAGGQAAPAVPGHRHPAPPPLPRQTGTRLNAHTGSKFVCFFYFDLFGSLSFFLSVFLTCFHSLSHSFILSCLCFHWVRLYTWLP